MRRRVKAEIGARLLASRMLGRKVPLFVGWAVTGRCNAACSYCDRWREDDPDALDTTAALDLVDQLADTGTRMLSLSGGEALLREDLPSIVERAQQRGIHCSLNTNGRLLPARIDDLRKLQAITVSVDAPADTTDSIRGAGAFDKAMAAIRAARDHGVPASMVAVLSRHNLDEVPQLVEIARAMKTTVTFQPADWLTSRNPEPHPHAPTPVRMHATLDLLIQSKRRGEPVGNTLEGLRHLRRWPGPAAISCAGGLITCNIEPDGRLYACSRIQDDVPAQRVTEGGFARAWANIHPVDCGRCWCARRVELNLLYALSPRTILQTATG